ncbi:MAG: HAD hydrolase-like protein [Candidatus Omnitrophota bacterium]
MISLFLILAFLVSDVSVYAQSVLTLPAPGGRVSLSPAFTPPLLKGIKVYANDPFRFDFILDRGVGAGLVPALDKGRPQGSPLHDESNRLIKYFLAALTIPEKDLWVNLSPYEKDRIVPEAFGQTEMGRDLLAQDYILKQITASLMYPEGDVGKKFWNKVYAAMQDKYGTTDIPVDTFNKVWIVPEKATVYENKDAAYVVGSRLKVMLDSDYTARVVAAHEPPLHTADKWPTQGPAITDGLAKGILREVIIPLLEKEVNEGENFTQLRQVYHSLILATWYKRKIVGALHATSLQSNPLLHYVDHNKTVGVDIADKNEKEKIWAQYVAAFKKGVFNYISDDVGAGSPRPDKGKAASPLHTADNVVPRQYFSGGCSLQLSDHAMILLQDIRRLPMNSSNSIVVSTRFDLAQSTAPLIDLAKVDARHMDRYDPETIMNRDLQKLGFNEQRLIGMKNEYMGSRLSKKIDDILSHEVPLKEFYLQYRKLLAVGIAILEGYAQYETSTGARDMLSPNGHNILNDYKRILGIIDVPGFEWKSASFFNEFKNLIGFMPRNVETRNICLAEVLKGWSDEQKDALITREDKFNVGSHSYRIYMAVTQGCRNQCLYCYADAIARRIYSLPMGIILNLKNKLYERQNVIFHPYEDSDPIDYYDPVIGANIADLSLVLDKKNTTTEIITRGLPADPLAEFTVNIIKNLSPTGTLTFSLDVYQRPVENLLVKLRKANVTPEERNQAIQSVIDKYTERYWVLVNAALDAGLQFKINKMSWLNDDVRKLIIQPKLKDQGVDELFVMLQEMDSMSERVKEGIISRMKTQYGLRSYFDIERSGTIYEDAKNIQKVLINEYVISWFGKTLDFLRRQNIPSEVIGKMLDKFGGRFEYRSVLGADGLIRMFSLDGPQTYVRRVEDLFPDRDNLSERFIFLIDFLKILLGGNNEMNDVVLQLNDQLHRAHSSDRMTRITLRKNNDSDVNTQNYSASLSYLIEANMSRMIREWQYGDDPRKIYDGIKNIPVPAIISVFYESVKRPEGFAMTVGLESEVSHQLIPHRIRVLTHSTPYIAFTSSVSSQVFNPVMERVEVVNQVDNSDNAMGDGFVFNGDLYQKINGFLSRHRFQETTMFNGTVYAPAPVPAIYTALKWVQDEFHQKLLNAKLLDFGAGPDLRASLIAANLFGMKVTSVEKDHALAKQAQGTLEAAAHDGLSEGVEFEEGDALDEKYWNNKDVVMFFYTHPENETASFRSRLNERMLKAKPGTLTIMFFAGSYLGKKLDEFEGLKPVNLYPIEISQNMGGIFMQVYQTPLENALVAREKGNFLSRLGESDVHPGQSSIDSSMTTYYHNTLILNMFLIALEGEFKRGQFDYYGKAYWLRERGHVPNWPKDAKDRLKKLALLLELPDIDFEKYTNLLGRIEKLNFELNDNERGEYFYFDGFYGIKKYLPVSKLSQDSKDMIIERMEYFLQEVWKNERAKATGAERDEAIAKIINHIKEKFTLTTEDNTGLLVDNSQKRSVVEMKAEQVPVKDNKTSLFLVDQTFEQNLRLGQFPFSLLSEVSGAFIGTPSDNVKVVRRRLRQLAVYFKEVGNNGVYFLEETVQDPDDFLGKISKGQKILRFHINGVDRAILRDLIKNTFVRAEFLRMQAAGYAGIYSNTGNKPLRVLLTRGMDGAVETHPPFLSLMKSFLSGYYGTLFYGYPRTGFPKRIIFSFPDSVPGELKHQDEDLATLDSAQDTSAKFVRDDVIDSKEGTAALIFADQKEGLEVLLKPADLPKAQDVFQYIDHAIEKLAQRIKNPENKYEEENLPKIWQESQKARAVLKDVYAAGQIWTRPMVVVGKTDYSTGYFDNGRLIVSHELLTLDLPLLSEYLLYLVSDVKFNWRERSDFGLYLFADNYPMVDRVKTTLLKNEILRQVMARAAVKDGIDHTAVMKDVLESIHTDVRLLPIYTDETDPYVMADSYAYQSGWADEVKEMLRSDKLRVIYGALSAVIRLAESYEEYGRKESIHYNLKIMLDQTHGAVGFWGMPEGLNDLIKEYLKERQQGKPVIVDLVPFAAFAAYYESALSGGRELFIQFLEVMMNGGVLRINLGYETFRVMMSEMLQREKAIQDINSSRDVDQYEREQRLRTELGIVRNSVLKILSFIDRSWRHDLVRQFLLEMPRNKNAADTFAGILAVQSSHYDETAKLDLLSSVYQDPRNSPSDDAWLAELIIYAARHDDDILLSQIHRIFRDKRSREGLKGWRLLRRFLPDTELDSSSMAAMDGIFRDAGTYEEVVAAYYLAWIKLFGAKARTRRMGSFDSSDAFEDLLSTINPNVYAHVSNIYHERHKGTVPQAETDHRILDHARSLDGNGSYPGENGETWFTALRQSIHRSLEKEHFLRIKTILRFWDSQNEAEWDEYEKLSQTKLGMRPGITQDRDLKGYSRIIHQTREALIKAGQIPSDGADDFIEYLPKLDEEPLIHLLQDVNAREDAYVVHQVAYMVRLYYALFEKFSTNIPLALKAVRDAGDRFEFAENEHRAFTMALERNDIQESLSRMADLRLAIKDHIVKNPELMEDDDIEDRGFLLEMDHALQMIGRDFMNTIYSQHVDQVKTMDDVKLLLPSLVSMVRFVYAGGVGRVDVEQFIDQMQSDSLTLSQWHDLLRAMQLEILKGTQKISREMRTVLIPMLDTDAYHHFLPEWQPYVVLDQPKVDDKPWADRRMKDESRDTIANAFVDELIRNSGVDVLKAALTKLDHVLEKSLPPEELTSVTAGSMALKTSKAATLDNEFLRFGQPDSKPVPGPLLLSRWSKKGLNLLRMFEEGVNVPPGFVVSTRLMTRPDIIHAAPFKDKVLGEIERLRQFSKYPDLKLLLYARSGSAFMLPGLLTTIHNIGMNDNEARELAESTKDAWFAYDTYASFIRAFAVYVFGIDEKYFEAVLDVSTKDKKSAEEMKLVVEQYKAVIKSQAPGREIPSSMIDQVIMAMEAVYKSWDAPEAKAYRQKNRISQQWGTVVILQKGMFGNLDTTHDGRISGVGSARLAISAEGNPLVLGEFRYRGQGDQIMSHADQNTVSIGKDESPLKNGQTFEELNPVLYQQLLEQALKLKKIFGYEPLFEFVIERGDLWITQSNDDYERDNYPEFADDIDARVLVRGKGLTGGAVRGWVANSIPKAIELFEKYNSLFSSGSEEVKDVDGVILVLDRVNPEMIAKIPKGIHLLARRLSVHAISLAQDAGISVVAEVPEDQMIFDEDKRSWVIAGESMSDGDIISIDGHRNSFVYHLSGNIYKGSLALKVTDVERNDSAQTLRVIPNSFHIFGAGVGFSSLSAEGINQPMENGVDIVNQLVSTKNIVSSTAMYRKGSWDEPDKLEGIAVVSKSYVPYTARDASVRYFLNVFRVNADIRKQKILLAQTLHYLLKNRPARQFDEHLLAVPAGPVDYISLFKPAGFRPLYSYNAGAEGAPYYVISARQARDFVLKVIVDAAQNDQPFAGSDISGYSSVHQIAQLRAAAYERLTENKVPLFQTTIDFIKQDCPKFVKRGIGSASLSTRKILMRLGLAPYFDVIVDGQNVKDENIPAKPSLYFYTAVAAKMGVDPRKTVVVGDARSDMISASGGNFGLVIGMARENNEDELKQYGAHLVIHDMKEVSWEMIRKMLPEVEGIIFDNDGVIIDTEPIYFKASQIVFNDYFRLRETLYGEAFHPLTLQESDRFLKGTGPVAGVQNLLESRGIYLPLDQEMLDQKGGIDLNPSMMDWQSKSFEDKMPLNVDQAAIARMKDAAGLTPVIVGVYSLENLTQFLGVAAGDIPLHPVVQP